MKRLACGLIAGGLVVFVAGCADMEDEMACIHQFSPMYRGLVPTSVIDQCIAIRSQAKQAQDEAAAQQAAMDDELKPYSTAADRGDGPALYATSLIYRRYGRVVAADQRLSMAAQAGYGPAQIDLGRALEAGDEPTALDWLSRAAAQGQPGAAAERKSLQARIKDEYDADQARIRHEKERAAQEAFIDKVIAKDSVGWVSDQYQPGSVHAVERIEGSDGEFTVKAYFRYLTANSAPTGGDDPWVVIKFHDYLPICLQYWNFSDQCRRSN